MSDHVMPQVLLVGAGPMAIDYARVLTGLGVSFTVLGRGAQSAQSFTEATGLPVTTGGAANYLRTTQAPEFAIVATGVEALAENVRLLLEHGVRKILVEKPAALHLDDCRILATLATEKNAAVLVGYNRRFYASVFEGRKLIEEDGGVREVYFEFTEWQHRIAPLVKGAGVKQHWFLANSTHVADLAFHLAGTPADWNAFTAGTLDWHPSASRFAGSGITDRGVLFTYAADWEAPGRWGIELLTAKRRLYYRPMEQLQVQLNGELAINPVPVDDTLEKQYKPGLYRQTEAFLNGDDRYFCSIQAQLSMMPVYNRMANYE